MAVGKEDSKARIGITVMFSPEERQQIRRAVVETDGRSASEFIRAAAVKAAVKVVAQTIKALPRAS